MISARIRPRPHEQERKAPDRIGEQHVEAEDRVRDEPEHGERREPSQVLRHERAAAGFRAAELDREPHAEQDAEHRPEALFEEQLHDLQVGVAEPPSAHRVVAEMHQEHAQQRDAA
jgi:hypothetical protein